MSNLNSLKILFLPFMALMLASCSSLNGAVGSYFGMDTDLKIDFIVNADINPDEYGKASPLFIRMYELKAPKMMKHADFIDIYERDKEVLGEELVTVHKLRRFKPGESRTEHYVLDKNANYVAFYAEFLEFKDSKYKVIVPVVANNVFQSTATVHVSKNRITVERTYGAGEGEFTDGEGIAGDAQKAKEASEGAQGMYDKIQGMQ
jgi:type VI secretion system protein VasD